jgi:predicted aspartyl protease
LLDPVAWWEKEKAMFAALLAALLTPAPPPPTQVTTLQSTSTPGPQDVAKDHLPLAPLPDDRLTVNVTVGGQGPYRFLVDTGSDRSAVSTQMAKQLGFPAGRPVQMHSVTGKSQVRTAAVRGMNLSNRSLPDINAALLDASHVRADGILGTDVLRSSVIRFDFRAGLLSISSAGGLERRVADKDTIVVEGRRRAGRLIVTEAEADGQRLTVILDTGSEVTVGNQALRRALVRRGVLQEDRSIELLSVTGELLPATYMQLRRLDIGGLALGNLGIAFADAHTFGVMGLENRPALLLGMNALLAFDSVTIDLADRKLRFVMPSEGPRRGS